MHATSTPCTRRSSAQAEKPAARAASRFTPELTETELLGLFHRWQQDNDRAARDRLVSRYMPLARKLALRYTGANEPIDDLVQVASVGLLLAINRFDPDRGIAFSSFAVPTILGELRRYFRDAGWSVHVPRSAQERALCVERAIKRMSAEARREPTPAMVAEQLEWDLSTVLDALEALAGHHSRSLCTPIVDGDGERKTVLDSIGSRDQGFEMVETGLAIGEVLRRQPATTRNMVRLRSTAGLTQTEIAARTGVSQMQVSRVLRGVIAEIHSALA